MSEETQNTAQDAPLPVPELQEPELSADELAVKANQEAMAVLTGRGLLTDSFVKNLALR